MAWSRYSSPETRPISELAGAVGWQHWSIGWKVGAPVWLVMPRVVTRPGESAAGGGAAPGFVAGDAPGAPRVEDDGGDAADPAGRPARTAATVGGMEAPGPVAGSTTGAAG